MAGTVIISGGSGGIGRAISLALGKAGYRVFVGYRGAREHAEEVASAIFAEGGDGLAGQLDVCSDASVEEAFDIAERAFGPVTALVNNAGIVGGAALVGEVSSDVVSRVFETNVVGAFRCAKRAIRSMSTSNGGKGGAIVNVSSRASAHGSAGEWVHYAASKGAIDTFTIGLAREVAAEGIRVNAVNPGLIRTAIHAGAGDGDRLMRLLPDVPMGRLGEVQEVASVVKFLLSSEASYVTGACVEIGGGR